MESNLATENEFQLGFRAEPAEVYHSTRAINSHGLITIANRSPLHYYTQYIVGEKKEPTPAMKFGSTVHTALLEPEKFKQRMVLSPECGKRSKADKLEWEAFNASLSLDAIVINSDEMKAIEGMLNSLMDHKIASGLLKDGIAEHSGYFEIDGLLCKIRPDYLRSDGVVIDLKTTMDASREAFSRQIANLHYFTQAAWYADGSSTILGKEIDTCIFIAVEKDPPYACAVYVTDPTVVEKGRFHWRKAFDIYKQCMKTNHWPGYQTEAQNISLPYWAMWEDE